MTNAISSLHFGCNLKHCALWYFCGSRMILLTHKWFGQETSPRYGARVSLTAWSLSGLTNYKSGRLLLHTQKLLIYTLYLVHQRCHLAWSRFFCFNWFFLYLLCDYKNIGTSHTVTLYIFWGKYQIALKTIFLHKWKQNSFGSMYYLLSSTLFSRSYIKSILLDDSKQWNWYSGSITGKTKMVPEPLC